MGYLRTYVRIGIFGILATLFNPEVKLLRQRCYSFAYLYVYSMAYFQAHWTHKIFALFLFSFPIWIFTW